MNAPSGTAQKSVAAAYGSLAAGKTWRDALLALEKGARLCELEPVPSMKRAEEWLPMLLIQATGSLGARLDAVERQTEIQEARLHGEGWVLHLLGSRYALWRLKGEIPDLVQHQSIFDRSETKSFGPISVSSQKILARRDLARFGRAGSAMIETTLEVKSYSCRGKLLQRNLLIGGGK